MSRVKQRAKPKAKARKAPISRRKTARKRSPVPRKATNWLHARARAVKRGENMRGTVLGLFCGFAATIVLALWLSGGLGDAARASQAVVERSLLASGFGVAHIEVVGSQGKEVSDPDKRAVRQALAVEEGELVFSINLKQALHRIENIGWVKEARIMRQLPNRLTIIVVAREPFALWQSSGQWHVVGENGKVIVSAKPANFSSLPLVVGKGASEELPALLVQMQKYPRIAAHVHAYVRISERRWNLRLNNGADLMLPAHQVGLVLSQLHNDPKFFQLLKHSLERIDVRNMEKILVRPRTAGQLSSDEIPGRVS